MSITIDLPAPEMAALKRLTRLDDDAQAVIQAAREFIRLKGLRELMSAAGKVEFDVDWKEMEELELRESEFPQ